MTIDEVLDNWMDERKVSHIQKYESSGRKASGRFGQSVRIEAGAGESQMYGASHIWFAVNGRKPNKDQSKEGLMHFAKWAGHYIYKDWMKQKGLIGSPYALAYHIGKNGITVPNSYNDGRLLQDTIYDQTATEDLKSRIGRNFLTDVKQQIQQIWQQV